MYQNIIVPIDLGQLENGKTSITLARGLVNDGGSIHLVNVVENIAMAGGPHMPMNFMKECEDQARKSMKELYEEEGLGEGGSWNVLLGPAAMRILDYAEEHNGDLVIVASHRPGLKDYFLGSTAGRVVRHAQCPVLVNR
ncbi:MAG: universal stress protein [Pseudomonadota bacterium]